MQKGLLNPNSSGTWRKTELVSKRNLLQIFIPGSWVNYFIFFPPFPKLSSTGAKGILEFSHGPGLAKLPSHAGSGLHDVLYSSPPQPVSWPCTETLLLWVRCERTRGNPPTDRERTAQTNRSTGACCFAQRLRGGLLSSPVLPHRQQITAHVSWSTPDTQDDIQEVHHCCSPTAKLPFEYLTVKHKNENSIKDERDRLRTIKSNDTNSFPSFI